MTSLAVADSTASSIVAFAGINSSEADQKAGRNQHLRSFELHHAAKDADSKEASDQDRSAVSPSHGETKALWRTSLFTSSSSVKPETYQRVLRLLRTSEKKAHVGAIATGLAPQGEVVVFDASKTPPDPGDVLQRINLGDGKEAADIDLIHGRDGGYRLAYCTDYEVYLTKFNLPGPRQSPEPEFVHGTPHPDTFASSKARPKFRSLRFLAPNLILLLQNKANRQGAELLLLEVPKLASLGMIILRKRLPKSIQAATALSAALLPTPSSSHSAQHAIAIAGQDNSITILTIDHPFSPPFGSLQFSHHATLPSVHPLQITSLTFSSSSTFETCLYVHRKNRRGARLPAHFKSPVFEKSRVATLRPSSPCTVRSSTDHHLRHRERSCDRPRRVPAPSLLGDSGCQPGISRRQGMAERAGARLRCTAVHV